MPTYDYSNRSLDSLQGVHPLLVTITTVALRHCTQRDFIVLDGRRTEKEQQVLVDNGKSWTMDSKHLVQKDGYAHAVDLGPLKEGSIDWKDWSTFEEVAQGMKSAAHFLNIPIVWGGDWDDLRDGSHFQLEV